MRAVSLGMRWWTSAVMLMALMGMPSGVAAQTTLLLEPLGEPLAETTQRALVSALRAVAAESGHLVLPPAPGTPHAALDPRSGDDLQALAGRAGVDRVIAVWVERGPSGYDILVAVASSARYGPASRARAASPEDLVDVATAALRELLPPDFATPRGGWEPPLDPHRRPPPSRAGRVLVAVGGVMLLGTYVSNVVGSALSGFRSTWWFAGTFDGAWDVFRVVGAVPVVGPWVQLAIAPTPPNGWIPWLVVDGVLQGLGAALLIAGISIQIDDTSATPWVGADGAGLRLAGTF